MLYPSTFRIGDFRESFREEYSEHLGLADDLCPMAEREEITSDLLRNRVRLRAMVEDSEDGLNHLLRYIDSQTPAGWLSKRSWHKMEENLRTSHREAGRLEAQVRVYLHIQVGDWPLQESKKSIELSNRQIKEGKRSKSCS